MDRLLVFPEGTPLNLPDSFQTVNRSLQPGLMDGSSYFPSGPWTVSSVMDVQPRFSAPSR